jgi:hypothetical protein
MPNLEDRKCSSLGLIILRLSKLRWATTRDLLEREVRSDLDYVSREIVARNINHISI